MWIQRDLEAILNTVQAHLPVQLVMGPRQTGKSSLLSRISREGFREICLDDLQARTLAQIDPALFLAQNPPPLIIDEAQHAPNLFPQIKLTVDQLRRKQSILPILFRMTGSQQILIDKNIKESLAGRASYFRLHNLSVHEIQKSMPQTLIDQILFKGGWPELYINPNLRVTNYLNDYIQTYVEKDIAIDSGIERINEFHTVLGLLAARTGELLNLESISKDAGVTAVTVKHWMTLLERAGLAGLLRPYSTNLNKRLIKTPKFFMLDSGLAARLQGHLSPETMMRSPQAGHLFETLVLGEIVRTRDHNLKDWSLFFWRTKEKEEYDFVITTKNKIVVLDAQIAIQSAQAVPILKKLQMTFPNRKIQLAAVTFGGRVQQLSEDCQQVPLSQLATYLVNALD